jgi:hypothetical protein
MIAIVVYMSDRVIDSYWTLVVTCGLRPSAWSDGDAA